jgi:hypothetical protein
MDDIMRGKLLRIALVAIGAIFFTIYPLGLRYRYVAALISLGRRSPLAW